MTIISFDFDRGLKLFSDSFVMEWIGLIDPELKERYTPLRPEEVSSYTVRLNEEWLGEVGFSKGAVLDRVYILQNKNDASDRLLLHFEFESTHSVTNYEKWHLYYARIESCIRKMPIYHILVFNPDITFERVNLHRVDWSTYKKKLHITNDITPYYPIFMNEWKEEELSLPLKALWRAITWAVENRNLEVNGPNDYIHQFKHILQVYESIEDVREIRQIIASLGAMFKLTTIELEEVVKNLVLNLGGEEVYLFTTLTEEEQKEVVELRRENAELRRENAELRRENAELRRENAELRRENAELRRENEELRREIAEVRKELAELRKEIAELRS